MGRRDGHYDGPDGMLVRVITRGADRGGANRSEMIGEYPEPRARQIAAKLARERGGRVVQDEHHPRALDVVVPNRGGRPSIDPDRSGPTKQFIFRCPTALIDRLDAHAEATGTTRSDLLRRGAERILEDTMSTLTATATADVIDGEITVDAPESDDTDILHHDGRVLGLRGELEPWGAEEFGMERADAQLAVMGWRRVSDWTGSEMLTATVVVRDA